LVTQYTNGGQNLTIPAHNHGTRMMYVPGMLEADDPYYANEGSDWSYVVNKTDITGLAGVSYTGGWWDQVTDNTNPVAVTTHNYSYYSVSTENTDNMGEFTCSVLGWPGETTSHRLRIKKGLVTYRVFNVEDETLIIDYDYNSGESLIRSRRVEVPNVYPTGTLHIGLNDNPDYMHNDGYVELTEGQDYFVFLFKITPNWNDYDECLSAQLVISKVGDDPNTALVNSDFNGSVALWSHEVTMPADGGTSFQNDYFAFEATTVFRKDIAHIKWDSANDRFIVNQLHTGPIMFNDNYITGRNYRISDLGGAANIKDYIIAYNEDIGAGINNTLAGDTYAGYTISYVSTGYPEGSTTADTYLPKQPSQIENPDIT
jgi:hypothetical protein